MAKVIGLGGLFFLCKDAEATRAWYARVLGIKIEEFGGSMFSHAASASMFPRGAQTVVDDMPGMIARLESEGVELEGEPLNEAYGHFVWIMDPDGRKVELWQPVEPPAE